MNDTETKPPLKLTEAAGQPVAPVMPIKVDLPALDDRLWNVRFRVHVKGEPAPRQPTQALVIAPDFNDVRGRILKLAEKNPDITYITIESIVWTDHLPILSL